MGSRFIILTYSSELHVRGVTRIKKFFFFLVKKRFFSLLSETDICVNLKKKKSGRGNLLIFTNTFSVFLPKVVNEVWVRRDGVLGCIMVGLIFDLEAFTVSCPDA